MSYKFPYFEDRPHIPITLVYKKTRRRFLPLLDSGADFSVFHKADAMRLGLNWKEGKAIELENADGTSFKAKEFKLQLEIERLKFKVSVCFVDKPGTTMPLLGRKDIFKHFKITINESQKEVTLREN